MQSSVIDDPDPLTTTPPTRSSGLRDKLLAVLRDVRVPAALASIVLSAWRLFLDNVVNNDGILYLRSAELLSRGEWQAALEVYKWPFYALLISAVSQITGLSVEYSAHVLNAALTVLTVVTFLTLIRELGGDRKTILAAAFVVLLYPGLNEYRSFVIRDTGYIAFYLFSLLLFIKNIKYPRWGLAIGWVIAMFVASLFRIEGFVFLVLLPFLEWLRQATTFRAKMRLFTTLVVVSFLLVAALAWWTFGGIATPDSTTVGPKLAVLLQSLWDSITSNISGKIAAIAGELPDRYSREFAHVVFIVALVVILLVEIFGTLTPLYAVLTGHALYRRLVFPVQGVTAIWLWLIILNLCILAAIVLVRLFLTGRFPLALSLTMMLAVPFSLAVLYNGWREDRGIQKKRRWLFPVVCVLFLLTGAEELYRSTRKDHLKAAGLWVRDNTPAQTTLFSNDPALLYYSGRDASERYARYTWQQTLEVANSQGGLRYDYLALRVKQKHRADEPVLVEAIGSDPIMTFVNRKGEKVLIFRTR